MIAGALIYLPESVDTNRLNGLKWERTDREIKLTSVIQFGESVGDSSLAAHQAEVIHQYILDEPTLKEKQGGGFTIENVPVVKTISADILVVGFKLPSGAPDPLIVVDNLPNRAFVAQIIQEALGLAWGTVSRVRINTARLSELHAEQWVRGFSDRAGHVDHGVVYGDAVEEDGIFGPELENATKQSIGWTTTFFGPPTRVRVSPRGSVVVWSWPTPEQLLRFIIREIVPYIAIV